ncbi:MAG: biopolymer transport protein ExbB/TolQ [Gammaproteobacteria bacterium]|jgi:biopolymer transport protein ExbB/TolQ
MTSSSNSTGEQTDTRASGRSHCRRGGDANWSGINIAAMVAGFVLFWPIGLFMLFWILIGREAQALPATIREHWSKVTGFWEGQCGENSQQAHDSTENVVFNEFQQTQYERIREIRDELRERARRFREYRANSRRRADEEEFDQFMSDAPVRNGE